MYSIPRRWLLPATLLATIWAAQAAPPDRAARADPLNAEAAVPPLVYSSPLMHYRRQSDDKLLPWREANDSVGRIGGWRNYAREAQQAASSAAPSASSPQPAGERAFP